MRRRWAIAFAGVALLYAVLQLGALGHPLLWQDEGETAMFGRRILDHGYPKVHGAEGVVYGMGVPLELAVDSSDDAYTGSLWGQYYLAALGVAWSDGAHDPHARTLRVRLPFALIGMAGLATLLLAMRDALASRSGSALPGATVFVLLLCIATSLQLHLREVRYYAPTVALVGVVVALWRALERPDRSGARRLGVSAALALSLVALLNVFYPVAVAVMAWLGGEALLDAWRHRRGQCDEPPAVSGLDARRAAAVVVPVVVAALVAIPLAVRFDVLALSRVFSERWAFGPGVYALNLGHLTAFLMRFELLGLVVLMQLALWLARAGRSVDEPARRGALALLRLGVWLGLVGAGNPIFFERYFVAISPLLTLALVLDGETLLARLARADRSSRRLPIGLLAVGVVATLFARLPDLHGRIGEILAPVSGPVDHVVALIEEEYADPSRLLIATNYEAEPLMFYLGSRVVGRFHAQSPEAIAAEKAERPDIVIPRSGHPRRLEAVRRYLLAGGYAPRALDVADTPYNAIPELYAGRVLERTHWFRAPRPGEPDPPLIVYERPMPDERAR